MRLNYLLTSVLIGAALVAGASQSAYALDAIYTSGAGTVEFRATGHPSALHVVGKGVGPQGDLAVDQKQVSGSLNFDLNSLDTGISIRDEHMKKKYLEVGKYPRALLTITSLKLPQSLNSSFTGATGVAFQGVLKLHGVEKPISGTVNIKSSAPNQLQTDANFDLKLTDFGIEIPKFMGITIADDVHVRVSALAQTH